ncbi:MotA/TolQ/ExbB proton channel family protein [Mesorhizobium sp. ESP-6-2]|uniref:MotA/TolQ/ExbB proton channel family protein n=1 Tax=Mesorhizobium sp. ESP-6-2 TaxID=2876625 RepID=UPI001CCFFB1E|nr:MotA/TolQ/ExbB proton channel family protein [Mesorhizobium sp. ESP-6-2]MBZ9807712.1 MotA/TolQ/ExbB proton channel family protein [Mesorhizobium sp. ESP-6-2]
MTPTTRLFILNFAGACFVAWAWWLGYVGFVFTHDVSHISYLISALFLASIAGVFMGKTTHLERVEVWLVTLGLIGNVVGFIIALQNIDTGSLGSAEGVQKVAASLLAGMGVAFCSTLVGAVAALWTSVNAWVLSK